MITDLIESLAAVMRQWHYASGVEQKKIGDVGRWCLGRRLYVRSPMIQALTKETRG